MVNSSSESLSILAFLRSKTVLQIWAIWYIKQALSKQNDQPWGSIHIDMVLILAFYTVRPGLHYNSLDQGKFKDFLILPT